MVNEIASKIQSGRTVQIAVDPESMGFHASMNCPTGIEFDHYFISSGIRSSEKEAITEFWSDYERQGPYKDGSIYWRTLPELSTERDFDIDHDIYLLRCRFSIG